jgi:hypothetical protein
LVGRAVTDFQVPAPAGARATIDEPFRFRGIDPSSPACPCQLAGRISGARPGSVSIAVALNGRIVATARGFRAVGAKKLEWSAMIPPQSLRRGRNTVELYRTEGNRLTLLGGTR